ncbi:DUF5710 domain-containing protein [Pseudomonas sp. RHF3.3-3]|uniref:DUF5710 domain-containing protein n=1 Tax=Pseudomonas sp. RHF3.3-3 TaxID=3396624 RepID=UPI003A837868
MARVDLNVPFSQKDLAKSLGARWDPQAKVWYVPDGVEIGEMERWVPPPDKSELEHQPEFRTRSPYYYVMESISDCWKCCAPTRVFSFRLPDEYEEFHYIEEYEDPQVFTLTSNLGQWKSRGYGGTVSDVGSLSPQVLRRIRQFTGSFRLDYSKMAGCRYFMNHCQHCGAKLGDFYMHAEPGGAFVPMSPEQAGKITLHRINERFDANCGVGFATQDFMEWMQIRD